MSAVFSNFVPIIKVPIMAYKKGEDRRQRTLFPDCIDDYVEQDSHIRKVKTEGKGRCFLIALMIM